MHHLYYTGMSFGLLMPLVTSRKLLHRRYIPAQNYSQLTSVFDRLLLCRLYEDIPLFFILYLKLYIMVWEMASASFE